MSLPVVAIVGRPNVGKSSFLNAVVGERVSIVHDMPGVTRDRVQREVTHDERTFELVDMGGIGIVDVHDLSEDVELQINAAVTGSDVIAFVVDVRDGITPLDIEVAQLIRQTEQPYVLLVNKVDAEAQEAAVGEFHALGLKDPHAISAMQGFGIREALSKLVDLLPEKRSDERPREEGEVRIAFVGQRNAGKSTMLNALAGEERVIVSEIPGTTRDSVDVQVRFGEKIFTAIDTAGFRKERKLADSIEFYSQIRAKESIRRADVVLFLIDASRQISQVEKKIADEICEHNKACVVVINKWDLAPEIEPEKYLEYFNDRLPFLHYPPVVFVSAKERTRLREMAEVAFDLYEQASHRIPTPELNKVVEKASAVRGPRVTRGKYPKIYYATQVGVRPPWIVLFVNNPKLFKDDFRRFLENRFREAFPFSEIPIRISFRQRESIYERARKRN